MKNPVKFLLKVLGGTVLMLFLLSACSSRQADLSALPTADIRNGVDHPATLKLEDEIESVSYVPLEVTDDDASLVDGVYDFAVTSKYIYVLPVKEPRIVLFDRQGRFLKTLMSEGQGSGEFSGLLTCIQADEKSNRLNLFSGDRVWIYTLEGEFVEQRTLSYQCIFQRQTGADRFAAVAFPFVPFQSGSFGLGIFSAKGDAIATKNDFYSPLLPAEKTGFTTSIAATYSEQQNSILFKQGSNDTVFRIADDKIVPACVLILQNSDKEVIRSLDVTDFSDISGEHREDKDFFVSDIFETPSRYYFRLRYNQGHCVASVDKRTGETLVERCEQPGTLREIAATNLQHGMLGTKSYKNFPIWGRMMGDNNLTQIVTPYELSMYKELNTISIPDNLKTDEEEGNPIFIFYKLKQ